MTYTAQEPGFGKSFFRASSVYRLDMTQTAMNFIFLKPHALFLTPLFHWALSSDIIDYQLLFLELVNSFPLALSNQTCQLSFQFFIVCLA